MSDDRRDDPGQIRFQAPDGVSLVGVLTKAAEPHGGVAVVCHPHPQHGGTMDSWMVPVLQRALVDDGWTALRFNFRGVAGSEGTYGEGEDELDDVAGAVERLLDNDPDAPLLVGGWSFGAHVSLRYALSDRRVDGWFGIALPAATAVMDVPTIAPADLESATFRRLFVHGSRDELTDVSTIESFVEASGEDAAELAVIEGGDHFLATHGDRLSELVRDFGRACLESEWT